MYLDVFKTSLLFFSIVAFIITIPFILIEYHKYGSIHKFRTIIIYSFILYLMTIYFLVILPLPPLQDTAKMTGDRAQLVPFSFVLDFIHETPLIINDPSTYIKAICHSSFYTVIFNIFMTIPFGMYLRYYFKCDLKKTIKYSFVLSLFFELTQLTGLYFIYPRPYRLFDVDDLMMNTLGGFIGFLIMGKLNKYLPTRDKIDKDTIESSRVVSGLRRFTIFWIDSILFIIIYMLCFIILPKSEFMFYILFIIYFVIIPYFWDGKTIGSNFVNVKFSFSGKIIIGLFIRAISPVIYFIFVPFVGMDFLIHYILGSSVGEKIKIMLMLFGLLFVFIYYTVSVIFLFKNKGMLYDRLSKVKFVSTLGFDDTKKD